MQERFLNDVQNSGPQTNIRVSFPSFFNISVRRAGGSKSKKRRKSIKKNNMKRKTKRRRTQRKRK
jgi:hypothetical protein